MAVTQRHKTRRGQLRPLEDRMTDKQYERRTAKIAMRVGREGAMTRGMVLSLSSVIGRGFWGRMQWLVLGR